MIETSTDRTSMLLDTQVICSGKAVCACYPCRVKMHTQHLPEHIQLAYWFKTYLMGTQGLNLKDVDELSCVDTVCFQPSLAVSIKLHT